MRNARSGLVLAALLVCAAPALAARPDHVVLANGDHITGEVKSLDRGRLKLKTDNAGDIYIEWDKIRSVDVVEEAKFDIETTSGHHLVGTLRGTEAGGLRVLGTLDTTALGFNTVVRITPLKSTFWGKVDGSVDMGASLALANHLRQLNTAMTAVFRERKYSLNTDFNTTILHQDNVPDTRRATVGLSYSRFFESRWQAQARSRAERNDQLGLTLRLSADGGIGRYLMQSNTTLLDAGVALSVNQEHQVDGTVVDNLEGVLSTAFSTFVYDSPKVNVDVSLRLYPGLSDWGRNRFEASAVAKREIVKDFFLGINGFESFDSRPPAGGTNNDWNVYFSIGWTF